MHGAKHEGETTAMNRLDGKIAVVTGGTQGLGAAIARRFAEAGAAGVVTCGRSAAKGEAVAAAITADTGAPVAFVAADLARVADCRAVIAAADDRFGRVDVLVNAAGLTDRGTLLDTSEALFDAMMAVNVRAPFFLMQDAVKLMIRDGVAGRDDQHRLDLVARRPAVHRRLLRLQGRARDADAQRRLRADAQPHPRQPARHRLDGLGRRGPRPARVPRRRRRLARPRVARASPSAGSSQPEEVARAVAFLASEDSGLMTGAVVQFDQSVWGAYDGAPPTPAGPATLPAPG